VWFFLTFTSSRTYIGDHLLTCAHSLRKALSDQTKRSKVKKRTSSEICEVDGTLCTERMAEEPEQLAVGLNNTGASSKGLAKDMSTDLLGIGSQFE